MLTEIHTDAVAGRLMEFLETGIAPEGLFTPNVFCDFTMPLWRLQAEGLENVVALRRQGHPGPSSIPHRRCDATATGFVLEIEELGRGLAMIGIAALIATTAIEQKNMLDIVNEWVGGAYF